MKPAPFEYYAPRQLGEALDILTSLENARPLAGGQSLVPMLNFRIVVLDHLVDLNEIAELAGIVETPDRLWIGSMTRQRELENSPVVARCFPMLPFVAAHIGHQQTRNRGTIGGSICHLDPGAELPVAASALDASLIAVSHHGTRILSIDDFAVDYLTNCLDPGELLLALEIPKCNERCGMAFEEFSRRPADLAIVSVASLIEFAPDGTITKVAIAIGGLGAGPIRLRGFESACIGARLDEDVVRCATRAAAELPVIGQGEYTSDYRSHLAGVLSARSLKAAGNHAGLRV